MAIYGTGTIDLFKPEVWAARLQSNLQKKMVYGALANREYEGQIKGVGDTVHVHSIGRVALTDYTIDGDIPALTTKEDNRKTLTITRAKAFNIGVDDIDKVQAQGNVLEEYMKEAAYALGDDVDTFIASLYTGATASGVTAITAATGAKLYDAVVGMRQKFLELNVPIDDCSVVMTPAMEALLLKEDRFIHATSAGDGVIKNGQIGRMAGFDILVSNNVPRAVAVDKVLAFSGKAGISLAAQINKTEAYRPQNKFMDAVKGLHVYGAAVMRPEFVLVTDVTL